VPLGAAEGDTNSLSLEHYRLALPQWDAGGLRVAVLADVHMNRPRELAFALEAAKAAIEEKPDLILMPGDFINNSDHPRIAHLVKFLDAFREAKCPVVATLGNHDYAGGKPALLVNSFAASPVRLLRNETAEYQGVTVAGFDDAIWDLFRPDFLTPGRQSRSLLAMLHEPDFVSRVPTHISLQLSGHSHGGQVCLPFGYAVHTPYGAWKYSDGYYPEANVPLFVTRGIGVTGIPYRLFCRPQVAILTLDSA
jgi:predicted MPP superfamily phosphohydrolase